MSARFVATVTLGIVILHQAGTALLISGLGRPREAILLAGLVFLLYPLGRIARSTGRAREVLRLGPAPAAAYPLAFVALVSAMPLALAVGELVAESPGGLDEVLARVLHADGARGWILALLAAAVVPALGEELLFRGFLQRGLEPRIGPAAAIAVSSLAFGLIHGPGRALPATLLGALLGWIAWRSGSVRPGIFAHLLSNAAAVVASNVRGEGGGELWSRSPDWPVAAGGAVLAAAALLTIARLQPGEERPLVERAIEGRMGEDRTVEDPAGESVSGPRDSE
jgi:membrane protease YdiL (CAAX protease family)